jgi:hypothetical protein
MSHRELQTTILELADLLSSSGWPQQAEWLLDVAARVETGTSADVGLAIRDLLGRIAGIGSLSDLPLAASPTMTEREARLRQDLLLDRTYVLATEAIQRQ